LIGGVSWARKKEAVAQLAIQPGALLARNSPNSVPSSPIEENRDAAIQVTELRNLRPPESELVCDFYRRWLNSEAYQPTANELTYARQIVARYGRAKAKAIIPLVVEQLRTNWPEAKTFKAIDRYLPDASRDYDRLRRRESARRRELQQAAQREHQRKESELARQQLQARWQPAWEKLSRAEQQQLRTLVLSRNRLLEKLPSVWHFKCLEELARRATKYET
jgi:hypothetical protein